MKSMLVFMAIFAFASASDFKLEKPADMESARIFYTNSYGSFLTLNETTLVLGVMGLIVLAGLYLGSEIAAGNLPFRIGQKKSGEEVPYEQSYYSDETQYETRYKRSASNDIASKMAQLEQAFKKYQVEEAECEMYIACEASQVQRIEENGPLARIVFDILSTFNREKDGHKWDDRMEGLVKAFEFGTGASASGQVDPCQPLRNKCFELHAKY